MITEEFYLISRALSKAHHTYDRSDGCVRCGKPQEENHYTCVFCGKAFHQIHIEDIRFWQIAAECESYDEFRLKLMLYKLEQR